MTRNFTPAQKSAIDRRQQPSRIGMTGVMKMRLSHLTLALAFLATPSAFGQSMPSWKSATQTGNVRDLVLSAGSDNSVAAWLGKKTDVTNGTATGLTRKGGSDEGTDIRAAYADSLRNPLSHYLFTQNTRPRYIFFGGADHLPLVASGVGELVASGKVGLYEHGTGMAFLSSADRAAIQSTWVSTGSSIVTGGGETMGEVGIDITTPLILSYFGGAYPKEVNSNIVGTGTYTDTTGTRNNFFSSTDLAKYKIVADDAFSHGVTNYAPVVTPNSFLQNSYNTNYSTDPFYENTRTAALYGGGIALDVPPSYAFWQGTDYINFVVGEIKWGLENNIRVTMIFSPYNVTANAPDTLFLTNTQRFMDILIRAGAVPTSYVIESYCACNTSNPPAGDSVADSTNQVAMFMLTQPVSPAGTAMPVSTAAGATSEENAFLPLRISNIIGGLNTNVNYKTFSSDLQQVPYVGNLGGMAYQSPDSFVLATGNIGLSGEPDTKINVFLNTHASFLTQAPLVFQGGGPFGNQALTGGNDNWLHLANPYTSDITKIGLAFGTSDTAPVISLADPDTLRTSSKFNFNGGNTYGPLLFQSTDTDLIAHPILSGGSMDHYLHIFDAFTSDKSLVGLAFNTTDLTTATEFGSIHGMSTAPGLQISAYEINIDGVLMLQNKTTTQILALQYMSNGAVVNDSDTHTPVIYENGHWYPMTLGPALQ